MTGLLRMARKLLAFCAVIVNQRFPADAAGPIGGSTLKIRIFANGRLTLDGKTISLPDLRAPLKNSASRGGDVWIFTQKAAEESQRVWTDVLREVGQVNLRVLFSQKEDFSGVFVTDEDSIIRPSKCFSYTSPEDFKGTGLNETETSVFLSNLELRVRAFVSQRGSGYIPGFIHIAVALRPNRSRIWLLYPQEYPVADMHELTKRLSGQPLPTMQSGVVAFCVSVEVPKVTSNPEPFDMPVPPEWVVVSKSAHKTLRAAQLLDIVWRADEK